MRCETSFFSLTLYRKHLLRYWPMWATWLAGWLLTLPVNLWNERVWRSRSALVDLVNSYEDLLAGTSIAIAIVAPLVAVAVLFHLFKSPAANFIGALPMRREGVFATAFAAGYTMLTVPLAVVCLVTLLVEWAVGAVAPGPILAWLGGSLLLSFFWFSFAVLCCVISGNAVAAVSFYVIFNGVVIVMVWLIQAVLDAFLYGFDQLSQGVWEAAAWLTPIVQTTNDPGTLVDMGRFDMLWIYAGVGFLMLLAALGLHHIRKAERAGDLIAFGPIRWVFRISVTLCGGLAFGMLLLALIFGGTLDETGGGAALAGCCAVAAMVSWFAAEMLLQKSFKVFKGHWKGAVIGALCFVVSICAIDMDWIGFTRHVPDPAQVRSATASFYGDTDPLAMEGLTYDADAVRDLVALHQYLVDHRDTGGDRFLRVELSYDLGLTTLRREYSWSCETGDQADALAEAAVESGAPAINTDLGVPVQGYISWGEKGLDRDLTTQEVETIWAAIEEDVAAGRYHPDHGRRDSDARLEFYWGKRTSDRMWRQIYIRSGATSTYAACQALEAQTTKEPESESAGGVPTAATASAG